MPSKFRKIIFRKKPPKQDSKNTSRVAASENEPPQGTADSKLQSKRSSITIETATTPSVQQTATAPPATSQSEQCAEGRVAAVSPTDSLGLNVLVTRDNAVVDILFLHGLTGHRDTTWTAEKAGEPWPKTLLSTDIVDARIITYGYDADVAHWTRPAGQNTIRAHAQNLINDFTILRRTTRSSGRPIIFVAHSLGGLVCQEALLVCLNPTEEYHRDILASTRGVAFLGTPHAGSGLQKFASAVADIINLCPIKKPNKDILEALNRHSQVLANIKDGFLTMVRTRKENHLPTIRLHTFVEELPVTALGHLVVTPDSAKISGYNSNTIPANHMDMTKFAAKSDIGYERVSGILKIWTSELRFTEESEIVNKVDLNGCLQSLAFPEMNDRGNDITPAAQGTCSWILKHKSYLGWTSQSRGLLWIKGKPGAGKSTLLKYALQTLERKEPSLPNKLSTLSFFFHGRGAEIQRNTLGFFRSLLFQLLERFPGPFSDVVQIFRDRCDKIGKPGNEWNWHPQELQDFLKACLPKVLEKCPILIMVDALDECGEKEAVRLVGCFQRLLSQCSSTKNGLSMCFSCRHYPIVSLDNGFEICVEHENHEDITKYIRDELQDTIQKDEELEVLKNEILDRSSYVFQWVVLVLPRALSQYRKGHSLPRIQQKLRDLPTELGGLYRDILQKLTEDDDERSQSLLLMQWIYFADRPLSITELRFAMIAGHDIPYHSLHECQLSPDFAENDKQMEKRIKCLSGGLAEVKIHQDNPVAQFIHQSVNDYLIKEGLGILASSSESEDKLIGYAHSRLSKSCIRYIATEEIHQWLSKHEESIEEYSNLRDEKQALEKEFPLAEYATISWLPHAVAAETKEVSQEGLLDSVGWPSARIMQDWTSMFRLIDKYSLNVPSTETTFLHEASRLGITSVVKAILSRLSSSDINIVDAGPKDEDGRTPLWCAAAGGREAVVKLLVATAGVGADSKDERGRTPLSWAARMGHEAVVKLLVATVGVDADSKDECGRTPLSWAARMGHEAVVKLLVAAAGVEADSKDGGIMSDWAGGVEHEGGRTPLSWAAEGGHEAVVKLLVATAGVDADSKDKDGRTPLSWAAYKGHEAVVKLLVATAGVDADSRNKGGRTPLSWAAKGGHEAVVKLLVATAGVDADSRNEGGRTPLSWVAANGNKAVVELLVETAGVDTDSKDEDGRTPLSWAAYWGNEAMVKLLVATVGVDADSKDKDGRTPLSWATSRWGPRRISHNDKNEAVVEQLVETAGVNADSKDKDGRTPLSWAAYWGNKAMVKLLVATVGVDADSKDEDGRTPLSWAAGGGDEAVVKLLVATAGVGADSKDERGRTPLSWAARMGHEAVVKLLVATASVNADSEDEDGRTPLSWAAQGGHEAVVRLLRSYNANS